MSSLTIDAIYRAMDDLGPPVPPVQICPSHYWPKVEDGTEMLRFEAHPIIKWLGRWLPITPYVEMEATKYRDADPIQVRATGVIYCSHAQANALERVDGDFNHQRHENLREA